MGGVGQAHRDRGRRDQHCSPTTNGDAGNPGELAVLERGAHLRSGYAPPPRKPDEGCVKKVEGPYGWRVDGRDRISGPPQRDPDAATLTTQGARSQRCELTILRTPLPAAECALAGLAPEARRLNSAIGALRRPLARSLPRSARRRCGAGDGERNRTDSGSSSRARHHGHGDPANPLACVLALPNRVVPDPPLRPGVLGVVPPGWCGGHAIKCRRRS